MRESVGRAISVAIALSSMIGLKLLAVAAAMAMITGVIWFAENQDKFCDKNLSSIENCKEIMWTAFGISPFFLIVGWLGMFNLLVKIWNFIDVKILKLPPKPSLLSQLAAKITNRK